MRQQGAAPGNGTRMPGASGTVAAISGSTAQVQNEQSGQVAVTWTAKTAFTQQVDATLTDVKVGACVAVTADGETTDGDPVAASSVRITQATDDGCAAGFGGMGGGPGGGGPGGGGPEGGERPEGAPTDLPSDLPTDRPGMAGRAGGGTFGEVTAVSADGFTVSSTRPGEDTKTTVEVTVAGATTYTTNARCRLVRGQGRPVRDRDRRRRRHRCRHGRADQRQRPGRRPVRWRLHAPERVGPVTGRRIRRGLAVLAVVGLVGGGYAAYAASGDESSYRTAVATVGDVEQTLALAGTVEPSGRADLQFGTSGAVATVAVAAGDQVKAGQVLVRLDRTSLTTAVRRARAQLTSAQAQLESDEDAQAEAVSAASDTSLRIEQ